MTDAELDRDLELLWRDLVLAEGTGELRPSMAERFESLITEVRMLRAAERLAEAVSQNDMMMVMGPADHATFEAALTAYRKAKDASK